MNSSNLKNLKSKILYVAHCTSLRFRVFKLRCSALEVPVSWKRTTERAKSFAEPNKYPPLALVTSAH